MPSDSQRDFHSIVQYSKRDIKKPRFAKLTLLTLDSAERAEIRRRRADAVCGFYSRSQSVDASRMRDSRKFSLMRRFGSVVSPPVSERGNILPTRSRDFATPHLIRESSGGFPPRGFAMESLVSRETAECRTAARN